MLSRIPRGQRARIDHLDSRDSALSGLQDARLVAWALAVGEIRSAGGRRYDIQRPHRGMLPDVDFAIAEPRPARPSLLHRLGGLIGRLLGRRAPRRARASPLSGPSADPLGESPPPSYIGVTEAGDPALFIRAQPTCSPEFYRAA